MIKIGTPNYPKDMAGEWNKLKREVKGAFSSANTRIGGESIGQKLVNIYNGLILHAGAFLRLIYANGSEALYIGQHTVSGNPVEGIIIRRPSGSLVFWAYGTSAGAQDAFWSLWDKAGNIVFSDDADSGIGIARPWLNYSSVRTALLTSPADTTTSTTYVPHHTVVGYMQHPRITLDAFVQVSGSDTAQVRVRDTTSGTVIVESSATGSAFITITGNHPNYMFGSWFKYDIEIKRASGTGSVGFTPTAVHGVQS